MKPLVSPVVEYRLVGIVQVITGLLLAIGGAVVDGPVDAAVRFVLVGAFFATFTCCSSVAASARRSRIRPRRPSPRANR